MSINEKIVFKKRVAVGLPSKIKKRFFFFMIINIANVTALFIFDKFLTVFEL